MNFAQSRRTMVDCQLRTFDITDRAVLAAMGEVPRERFVPAGAEDFAYADRAIEAGGAGMLPPMVLGRMVQALHIEAGDRVLDVGSGLGYSAAILHALGAKVTGLEGDSSLAGDATTRLASLGFDVTIRTGALAAGDRTGAPFDAILVNGAVELSPDGLLDQLAVGGRLACLQRDGRSGRAVIYVRATDGFGFRPLFDATATVLPDFARAPAFVF